MSWTRRLPAPIWKITMYSIPVAGVVWGIQVYRRTSATDSKQIRRFGNIPDSFRKSHSVSELVNVHNYRSMGDSRFITIELPPQHQDVSDEVLLAQFVKGYFGGSVISIERTVLQVLGMNLVYFSRAQIPPSLVQHRIWWRKQLLDEKLPPLHSVLFGVFQVLDVQLNSENDSLAENRTTESCIDFGFGSDQFKFAGAHRFSIVRSNARSVTGRELVQIHCHSMSCNPTENKAYFPRFMVSFHEMYNEYLFREGVAKVLSYTREA